MNQYTIPILICLTMCFSAQNAISAQEEDSVMMGYSKTVQEDVRIRQADGVDAEVDYRRLTQYGPWDDRNYGVTKADLEMLPEGDQYLSNVPAYYKIRLRKQMPNLGKYYPRSTYQKFLIDEKGAIVNKRKFFGESEEKVKKDAGIKGRSANGVKESILELNLLGNEVSVEANPNNKLEVVAGSNRTSGQTMYFSSDGGKTWTKSQTNPNSCCDPTIAWSSDGSKVYQADLSKQIGVRWSVSDDKGKTWGPMKVLTASGSDKEFIHVDHSPTSSFQDNIYLTYHNSTVMQFARSTDMGVSFDTPIAFPSEDAGIGSDITTDKAGAIYYVYPSLDGGGIRLLKSTDGGVSFGTGTKIADLNGRFDVTIPSMESRRAFIYVSADYDEKNDTIYVAWTDETDDSAKDPFNPNVNRTWVQVAMSTDGGSSWSVLPHPHANDGTIASGTSIDRYHPWISVEDGNVHIVYYDTRHSTQRSGVDLYFTTLKSGALTWETEKRFTTETSENLPDGQEWGDYNGLSVVLDNVVATWTDNRDSNDPATGDDKVAMAGHSVLDSGPAPIASQASEIESLRTEIEGLKALMIRMEAKIDALSKD